MIHQRILYCVPYPPPPKPEPFSIYHTLNITHTHTRCIAAWMYILYLLSFYNFNGMAHHNIVISIIIAWTGFYWKHYIYALCSCYTHTNALARKLPCSLLFFLHKNIRAFNMWENVQQIRPKMYLSHFWYFFTLFLLGSFIKLNNFIC